MATVIDAFVTTLGLDGTLFRRGMRDAENSRRRFDDASRTGDTEREKRERAAAAAAKKRQAEQDARVKATVAGYTAIRNQLLGLAAIFTAGVGIKNFVANTIEGAANLGYLSANLKQSTTELISWQRASERAGGSADGIIAQLKESQDTLAQLKAGMGPNEGLQAFFRWGGNADDLKDGNSYLLARSRIISGMFKVDPAQAALVAKSMGIGDDQFNFIKQGPDAVMALVHAQEKNAVITMRDAEAALELKNKMLDLRDSLQATGVKILTALLPSLIKVSDWLISMADFVAAHKDDIAKFIGNIVNADWSGAVAQAKEFGSNIAAIASSIREMNDRWDEWTGKPKKQTPGVEYFPGNFQAGKTEDIAADAKLRGKPAPSTGVPKNSTLATISAGIEEFVARTMASLGNQRAREFIRDTTGKDDYLAGPRKSADPKAMQGVMQKLKDMGWTHEQAAGITGSFVQESGLDPKAVNPRSGAYGIAQWLGPRVTEFKKVMGRDLVGSSLEDQLAFFDYEVTEGKEQAAGKRLAATRTAEDAARVHSEAYERPGTAEANITRRQQLARQLAAQGRVMNAASAAAMPSGAAVSARAASGGGSLGSTSTTTVNVEKIEVNTAATDAPGIAKAMRPAVEKYTFANQANSGMK